MSAKDRAEVYLHIYLPKAARLFLAFIVMLALALPGASRAASHYSASHFSNEASNSLTLSITLATRRTSADWPGKCSASKNHACLHVVRHAVGSGAPLCCLSPLLSCLPFLATDEAELGGFPPVKRVGFPLSKFALPAAPVYATLKPPRLFFA